MLKPLRSLPAACRYFGLRWIVFRLRYAVQLRTGALRRRMPSIPWEEQGLNSVLASAAPSEPVDYASYRRTRAPRFFFLPSDQQRYRRLFGRWDDSHGSPVAISEDLMKGTFRYFSHESRHLGVPPNWHYHPETKTCLPTNLHWSGVGDFDHGDIKLIWEPSRFAWTYDLVRSYWRTGDERYPELFWSLVEDWRLQNPPQLGVNWKCGQEVAFRILAWCFGLFGFQEAVVTTAERVSTLAAMTAVSAKRIEDNIDYALSQQNNHAISEAVGLWTAGLLFPEFRGSERWRERGRELLEHLGRELIYGDGSFAQHSTNYQRLVLQDYLWAIRLADVNRQSLSEELMRRVADAGRFLYQLQDQETGRLPVYGHNDGSLILPLNNCSYEDFRPVIQATHYLSSGARCYTEGPWDEDLLWLFGTESLESPIVEEPRVNLEAEDGGYYTFRTKKTGFALIRCAGFRHRPAHADMLHVDLWWRGYNIAVDPGTYSYNAEPPWDDAFAGTGNHNTVTVDGYDQMDRVGKFLWLPWMQGRKTSGQAIADGAAFYWEGEHDGYHRLRSPVRHRRAIVGLGSESWIVIDRLSSTASHSYRLHWLLADLPHVWERHRRYMSLETPAGPFSIQLAAWPEDGAASLVKADGSSPRGWRSRYYHSREPALSLDLVIDSQVVLFATVFAPDTCALELTRDSVGVTTLDLKSTLTLGPEADGTPVVTSSRTTWHSESVSPLPCTSS